MVVSREGSAWRQSPLFIVRHATEPSMALLESLSKLRGLEAAQFSPHRVRIDERRVFGWWIH